MKKLNLQLGSIKEMLTKEQMKKVAGGYNEGCDDTPCPQYTYLCMCYDITCPGALRQSCVQDGQPCHAGGVCG